MGTYLGIFRELGAMPEEDPEAGDDAYFILVSEYGQKAKELGTPEAQRRHAAMEALSWAVMYGDQGDDPKADHPIPEMTLGFALLTLEHVDAERDALLNGVRAELGPVALDGGRSRSRGNWVRRGR